MGGLCVCVWLQSEKGTSEKPGPSLGEFSQVSAIIKKTQDTAWQTWAPSTAKLVQVPDWMANSDHPNKKRPGRPDEKIQGMPAVHHFWGGATLTTNFRRT